ncbi:hypothetical protein P9112_007686 [Eukaryota sp. TZLM1-RC]
MITLSLTCILISISLVFAHYGQFACDAHPPFEIGQQALLSVDILGHEGTFPFYPKVDDFSLLHLYGAGEPSSTLYKSIDAKLVVQLHNSGENGSIESQELTFSNDEGFVPYFTIVINLVNGRPSSLVLDTPIPDRVSYSDADCSDHECDPRIYLAWAGTDEKGLRCHSVDSIFSRLRSHSLRSMVDTGFGFIDDIKDHIDDLIGDL